MPFQALKDITKKSHRQYLLVRKTQKINYFRLKGIQIFVCMPKFDIVLG